MSGTVFFIFFIAMCIATPIVIMWGWIRWFRRSEPAAVGRTLSFLGLLLATQSIVLAIGTSFYARFVGSFRFYDPRLLRIFRWGALLSLAGIACAVAGVWRRSSIRWHALACSLSSMLFWIVEAGGE